MRLTELSPQFHRYETRDGRDHLIHVDTLAEAQGIWFDCPKCQPYPHGVIVTFKDRGVLDHQGSHASDGRPSRWTVTGTGYSDLTLSPSVDLTAGGGCPWHGWVKNGEAT